MSKTDKTHPNWVKLMQNPQWRIEVHDHRHGECDILNKTYCKHVMYGGLIRCTQCGLASSHHRCYYWFRDGTRTKWWTREGSWGVQMYMTKHIRCDRNATRMSMRKLKKSTRRDIYDSEFGSYQHKHRAIWESW